MKKTVRAVGLVLLLLLALGMTACKGGANDIKTPTNAGNFFEKDPEHDFGGKEFVILSWWDSTPAKGSPQEAFLAKIAQKYNISKITWVSVPADTYMNRITTDMASGNIADVCWLKGEDFISMASKNMLQEINADFKESKVYIENFSNSFTYNGKQYGLVSDTYPEGLIYNKDLLSDFGFEDPMKLFLEGKWTWDAFREMCIGVMANNATDTENAKYGLGANTNCSTIGGLLNFIYSNGSSLFGEKNGKVTHSFEDANSMEALQFVHNLINVDKASTEELINENLSWGMFHGGVVAFVTSSGYGVEYTKNFNVDFDFGLVPYPKGPKASDNTTYISGINGVVFPVGTKDPIGASKVFEDFLIVEILPKLLDSDGDIDVKLWDEYFKRGKIYFSDDRLMRMCTDDNQISDLIKVIEVQKGSAATGYGMNPIINEMMLKIGQGKETPASAVASRKQQLQGAIDTILNQK